MKKNATSIVVGAFALGACFKLIRNNKKAKERTYIKLFEKKFEEIKKENEEIWGKTEEIWGKEQELETKIEDANKVSEKVKETA